MQASPTHMRCTARDPSASYEHAASGVLSGHFTHRHRDHEAPLTRSVLRGFPGMDRANAGVTPPAPLSMSMASVTRWRSRSGAEPALPLIVAILQHRMLHSVAAIAPCCHLLCIKTRASTISSHVSCICRVAVAPFYCLQDITHDCDVCDRDSSAFGQTCLTFTAVNACCSRPWRHDAHHLLSYIFNQAPWYLILVQGRALTMQSC